jgi:hypothetical protein
MIRTTKMKMAMKMMMVMRKMKMTSKTRISYKNFKIIYRMKSKSNKFKRNSRNRDKT